MNETAPNCHECGERLKPYIYFGHAEIDPKGSAKWGYQGNNIFCTLRCGYRFALNMVRSGRHTRYVDE